MATPGDITNTRDLTTCSICFETLKTPKHFSCLHSFCEGCIQTYITTTFQHQVGGVNCPVCRMFVPKPCDVQVEEWSKKLPVNHILVSLMDKNESKSFDKLCEACARDNETESVYSWCLNCCEALCQTCDRYHRKTKATRNHELVSIDEIDRDKMPSNVLCKDHPQKAVKMFCSDHSMICCMTCVMINHRKCEKVGSVQDAAEDMKKSNEVEEFEEKFEGLKSALETLAQSRTDNLENFDTDIKKMESDVEAVFSELCGHLKELKRNILAEIACAVKENRSTIVEERDEIWGKISTVENAIALFQTLMKNSIPVEFLQTMETLSEQKKSIENFLNDTCLNLREVRLTFERSEKLLDVRQIIQELGNVTIRKTVNEEILKSVGISVDMLTVKPVLSSEVNTEFITTGIVILESGHILLSNKQEERIELRDDRCSEVLSSLTVPRYPRAIKMTSDIEGAVAIEGHGLIIFNIKNNEVKKISEMKADVNHDFIHWQGEYYMGCNKRIAVYNNSHENVRDIIVNNNVGCISIRDENSLCYTVCRGRELHCINFDGTPVFTYTHEKLLGYRGITVDKVGYIYVCGFRSKNVHQLNHDGKLERIIFDNLSASPYSICLSTLADRAVIGCENAVLLYDLK